MTISEWKAQQTELDTLRLVRLAFRKPKTSTPQPDVVQEREAYSYETALRDIVVARYGPLSQYSGLAIKARFMLLRSSLKAAFDAAVDQAGRNQAMYDAQDIKSLNDQAKDVEGGMSHDDFLTQNESIPQPDVITYGDSPAVVNGWTDLINAPDEQKGDVMDAAS